MEEAEPETEAEAPEAAAAEAPEAPEEPELPVASATEAVMEPAPAVPACEMIALQVEATVLLPPRVAEPEKLQASLLPIFL